MRPIADDNGFVKPERSLSSCNVSVEDKEKTKNNYCVIL